MDSQLLKRHTSPRGRPALKVHGDIALPLARAHEVCGAARCGFALWVASKTCGPLLWIRPGWISDQLYPDGVHQWMGLGVNPGRLLTLSARRPEDLLWCMEEALRSGAMPLVICELPEPPSLTPVRRLHLAAETGAAEGKFAPIGLMLTPAQTSRDGQIIGGAAGVETRWHMAPRNKAGHSAGRRHWLLQRLRARGAAPQDWQVRMGKTGRPEIEAEIVHADVSEN